MSPIPSDGYWILCTNIVCQDSGGPWALLNMNDTHFPGKTRCRIMQFNVFNVSVEAKKLGTKKKNNSKFLVFQLMINSIWYINTYIFIIQIPKTLNLKSLKREFWVASFFFSSLWSLPYARQNFSILENLFFSA